MELTWVPEYLPALRSDLSRFHGVRDFDEELSSEEFFLLAKYITAYEGAVLAMARKHEEERKSKMPVPRSVRVNPNARHVSAEEALASINGNERF